MSGGITVVPLGEVVRPTRPRVKPSERPELPFIGMEHIEAHSMKLLGTVSAGGMKSAAVHFKPGDVLYGRLRPYLNKVYRPSFEGLCSAEFIVLPENERVDGAYLQYFLNSSAFVRYATHLNAGDRPRVDFDQIAPYSIPLPRKDEQRRIVAEIEKQFSRLDEGVANLKRVKANLKHYRTAAIQDVIGGARRGWPTRMAADLFSWSSGVNLPASKQHGGEVPVYGGNGIAGYHSQSNIGQPTIVIGRVGAGCGNVHLVREPAWITDNAIYASRAGDEVHLPYAALVFTAANLNGRAAGSGQPFVNQRMLNDVAVPLPSVEEQHQIVAEVDRRLSIGSELQAEVEADLSRAQALRHAILSAAFTNPLRAQ